MGTFLWGEDTLYDAMLGDKFHLVEPLKSCFAWIRYKVFIRCRGDVTVGKPAVVVCGADDAVKIDFIEISGGISGHRVLHSQFQVPTLREGIFSDVPSKRWDTHSSRQRNRR